MEDFTEKNENHHHHHHNHEHGEGKGNGIGGGHGRNKGGGFGVGGFCVCAKCGEKVAHKQGVKCTTVKCPSCNHVMVREELLESRKK